MGNGLLTRLYYKKWTVQGLQFSLIFTLYLLLYEIQVVRLCRRQEIYQSFKKKRNQQRRSLIFSNIIIYNIHFKQEDDADGIIMQGEREGKKKGYNLLMGMENTHFKTALHCQL